MKDLFALYAWFAIPALVVGLLPWALAFRRVRLRIGDGLQLLAPYLVWAGWVLIDGHDKSLANLIEIPILGALTGLFFAGRVALGIVRPEHASRAPLLALACSCLAAIALWGLFPSLPE